MKSYIQLLLVLCLAGIQLSCNRGSSSEATNDVVQIAVIPKGTTHQFWKSIHAGANKAATEFGVNVIWQGPQKEDDRQMQIQVVQNFISRNVDAIVLAPLDSRSLVKPVETAINRDIPVVIIDSALDSDAIASFVATDNRAGGAMAADRLASLLDNKGRIIMLRYQEGSASTSNREDGFLERIKEVAPDVEILVDNQYAGATIEKAFQVSQNLLNRYGEIDGIFCPNESTVQGMLRALQTAGKAGEVQLVGFDANDSLIEGMKQGHIQGLVIQDPFQMAYEGVATAIAVLRGEEVEPLQNTRVMLITPENMEMSEAQELLNPDLEAWLN